MFVYSLQLETDRTFDGELVSGRRQTLFTFSRGLFMVKSPRLHSNGSRVNRTVPVAIKGGLHVSEFRGRPIISFNIVENLFKAWAAGRVINQELVSQIHNQQRRPIL